MIKLVILDFDGTLSDTRELIVRTNQETQRRMHWSVCEPQRIIATIGLPLAEGIMTMCPDVRPEDLPQWIQVYREVFDSLKKTIIPTLFPHVKETLQALHQSGHTISVASSRGRQSLMDFLHGMGIAPYIAYVLGADDVTHAKPHPEPVLKTLAHLSVPAQEAIVVGDMPVDIQMGRGALAWTCGVTYGNSSREALLEAGANWVLDDFSDLLPLLSH